MLLFFVLFLSDHIFLVFALLFAPFARVSSGKRWAEGRSRCTPESPALLLLLLLLFTFIAGIPSLAAVVLHHQDTLCVEGSVMGESCQYLRTHAIETKAPFSARVMRQRCISTQSNLRAPGEDWRTLRDNKLKSFYTPRGTEAPNTIVTSRRPSKCCGTPRVTKSIAITPRVNFSSGLHCRHSQRMLASGNLDGRDRCCSLKPQAHTDVVSRSGVTSSHTYNGKDTLCKHEAQCRTKNPCRNVSQKTGGQKGSLGNRVSSNPREKIHSKMLPSCCQCGVVLAEVADVAKHKLLCPEEEVLCPLMCGKLLRRGDVLEHVKTQALLHAPLSIPNPTDCAGDDPKLVLALVMNLLLEKADCVSGSIPLTQTSDDMLALSKSTMKIPIFTSPMPHPLDITLFETSLSRASLLQSTIDQQQSPPLSYPRQETAEKRRTGYPITRMASSTTQTPEPRWIIPDPIPRGDLSFQEGLAMWGK